MMIIVIELIKSSKNFALQNVENAVTAISKKSKLYFNPIQTLPLA